MISVSDLLGEDRDQRTAVYRFFDSAGRLLYIGIASNLRTRWTQHAATAGWWPEVAVRRIEWFDTRTAAAEAEVAAINAEKPLHNVHSSPRHGPNLSEAIRRKQQRAANPSATPDAYRVVARRAGNWWTLEVPDVPGVFSQVRRLDKADDAAREAIALRLDVEPEDIMVSVEPELPDAVRRALAQVEQAAQDAADAERTAMQQAADVLTRELSQRDAGRILGVSFQRIGQLKKAS